MAKTKIGPAVAGDLELIPQHGGYRRLKSFQLAQLVYDVTARFCARYLERRSRTNDQMVQAARSGVQNIAEASQASGTSKKTELKLTSVARASLEELRLDYEDFLRQRGLPQWGRDDDRRSALIARRCRSAEEVALWVREEHDGRGGQCGLDGRHGLNGRGGQHGHDGQHGQDELGGHSLSITSMSSTLSIMSTQSTPPPQTTYPELAANAALTLIAVATSLLDRQLAAQAAAFTQEGGFSERLYRVRQEARRGTR